ncbi:glycosyltransferase involved in cell wall biosynthesis [Chryseobacterium sp. H1D6B]|uniref:glycosyltransferase family 2 protein n=1 Tax=Chryseobacterium sp. H1D6B TaxID=2940588 RepID=UPI0015C6D52E|nr:glycosyltransferase family A protein [Chryseobacterium sp. H1D6B]MDH6250681.1 glycosyltransferase involved in cell wall biosynthesis [Chryseobacterium sp. H1D6B]
MRISVIIPMFNAENTIIKCLNSVVNQLPSEELEVVIVDDGSVDKSYNLVKKFIQENSNFDIKLIHQENKGVSAARNLAIFESKYDLLALIDSDDVWLPGKLKHQLQVLSKYDADFVGTLHNNLQLGFPYKLEDDIFKVSFNQLMIKMAPSTITSLFKKDLIKRAGFYDEKQKYTEDGNLWLRFSKQGKMIILNKNYAIAGDYKPLFGQSGLSGNLQGMYKGEIKNIKDMLDLKYINKIQYMLYFTYITMKYYRRIVIVKLRK